MLNEACREWIAGRAIEKVWARRFFVPDWSQLRLLSYHVLHIFMTLSSVFKCVLKCYMGQLYLWAWHMAHLNHYMNTSMNIEVHSYMGYAAKCISYMICTLPIYTVLNTKVKP